MSLFRISFPLQMGIAIVLGIFFGLFLGEASSALAPWSSAYIMLLKVTAVPYLIVAIIHGVGLLNSGQGKQILKKGLLLISLVWFINIVMIYLIKFVFPSNQGAARVGIVLKEMPSIDFAQLLIPENIFFNLSQNIIPAVVVFSLLMGIALMHLPEKQTIMSTLQTILDVLTRITGWISRITPIGTFIIMTYQVGTIQLSTIKQVSTYLLLYILGTSIIVFWIFPRLVSMLTSLQARQWLKNLLPILVLGYTTNAVIVTLPYIIDLVQKETQLLFPKDEKARNQIQGTVSIIFNMPLGSLFITIFVFFVAVFYATSLGVASQIELFLTTFLSSLGAIGLGSWINSLTFILDALGLPIDAISFYLTTVPFTAGFQSMVSIMEISSLALLIILAGRGLLNFNWKKIVKQSLLIALPVLGLFGLLKFWDPLPRIQNETKTIFDLEIQSSVLTTVYTSITEVPTAPGSSNEDPLDRILRTKVLRVGYYPETAPFCFYNREGKLAGFDVAFAHELAFDLDCKLEFVPLNYGLIGEELDRNLYDIGMSAISITEERLKRVCFPKAYLEGNLVFITQDIKRKKLVSLNVVRANKNIKIADLEGSSFESLARIFFPGHEIVLIKSYDAYAKQPSVADILLWEEQEAIAWNNIHPNFAVIYPMPLFGKDYLGYAIKPATRFSCFLDQWLELKQNEGFTQKQTDLWILGKTEGLNQDTPRWSILHDVLHWVKN